GRHGAGAAFVRRHRARGPFPGRPAAVRDRARRDRLRAGGTRGMRRPERRREPAQGRTTVRGRRARVDGGAGVCLFSPTGWTVAQMFDYFPRLKERRGTLAGSLSGGEQQMLTICRSLLGNPRVLLIDEPTEGLAPLIVAAVSDCIEDIHRRGVSVVLVEQK